jgi:pimeloyl-ACP methyl ester carboxylesterase
MLAIRHRVVTFDFVDPPGGDGAASEEHYVAQALAVIELVGAGRPVNLVGYSFGAVIAAALAAERPDVIKNLILVAGWVKTDVHQRLRNDIWQKLRDSNHSALAEFMVFTAYSHAFLATKNEEEIAELVTTVASGPDRLAKMLFNRTVDISEKISLIQADTLVIGCTEDQMVPVLHSKMLFGGISRARYAEIPAGHGVVHERPSELFTLIDQFVTNPTSTTPGAVLQTGHA